MGKVSILTKEQQIILNEVGQNNYFDQFYFTGGTALSAIYLQHRYSDDLDFFSENKLDNQIIFNLLSGWGKKYGYSMQSRFVEVVYIFDLVFPKDIPLKIDFSYYPYNRLELGKKIEGIVVDSLLDIAVNKVVTLSQRTDIKDFVDLYFLLEKFTIWDLIEGVKVKFRREVEPFLLAADFLKVEDFTFLPRMLAPLSLTDLKKFYREKAQDLGRKSTF